LVAIARKSEKAELSAEARERILACRRMLEKKLANREIMYGTNRASASSQRRSSTTSK